MLFVLIFVYLLLFPITLIILLYKILDVLEKQRKEPFQKQRNSRKHPSIGKTSYTSPLRTRTNVYDKYKNKEGLYEPIHPLMGVKIEKREE